MTIFHDQKKVMRISGERAKAMADMAQAMSKDVMPSNEPPKATGKKQKVNGYETEEYATVTKKAHTSYWVATEYPQYKEIMKQMNVLQSGAFAALAEEPPELSGPARPAAPHGGQSGRRKSDDEHDSVSRPEPGTGFRF